MKILKAGDPKHKWWVGVEHICKCGQHVQFEENAFDLVCVTPDPEGFTYVCGNCQRRSLVSEYRDVPFRPTIRY